MFYDRVKELKREEAKKKEIERLDQDIFPVAPVIENVETEVHTALRQSQ